MSADRNEIDGPDVILRLGLAQPVALVLHELFENALMHGTLAEPEETLRIMCRDDGDRATIRWRAKAATFGTSEN
jgi:two-component sensor histidine kinase